MTNELETSGILFVSRTITAKDMHKTWTEISVYPSHW
jgi:hypothetical protein